MSEHIRVMIVEDDPLNMEALSSLVTAEGFEVVPAFDEQEALRHLEEGEPHVVLVDLEGPALLGVLARKARGEHAGVPVIVLWESAPGVERDGLDPLLEPANVVEQLTKPLATGELTKALSRHAPSFDNS